MIIIEQASQSRCLAKHRFEGFDCFVCCHMLEGNYNRLVLLIASVKVLYIYIYIVISSRVLFHNGCLLHSQFNSQLLTTVHNSSKNLAPV
jgi:hypothetical protein